MWNDAAELSSGRAAAKAKAKAKPGGNPGAKARQSKSKPSVGRSSAGRSVTGGGSKQNAKALKEIAASEQCCLSCKQHLRAMETGATFGNATATEKTLHTMLTKVKGRLTQGLVELYTAGYEPMAGVSTPGIAVWEELRAIQDQLEHSLKVVSAFEAASSKLDEPASLATAAAAMVAAKEKALRLPYDFLTEKILDQRVARLAKHGDFEALGQVLSQGAGRIDTLGQVTADADLSIVLLPEAQRSAFVARSWVQTLFDLLRAKDNLAPLPAFAAALKRNMQTQAIAGDDLRAELEDAVTLLSVLGDEPAEAEEVEDAKKRFETIRTRRLHKSIHMFPTGVLLQGRVGVLLGNRIKDEQCNQKLRLAQELHASISAQAGAAPAKYDGEIATIAGQEDLVKLRNLLASAVGNSNEQWVGQHKTEIEAAREPLKKARADLLEAIYKSVDPALRSTLEAFTAALGSAAQLGADKFETERELCRASLPNIEKTFELLVAPEDSLPPVLPSILLTSHPPALPPSRPQRTSRPYAAKPKTLSST